MNDYPWYFKNMIKKIKNASDYVGIAVTSLDDVPNLVDALEDFGQFQTAELISEWYYDIKGRVYGEHKDTATLA